jgi:hypothetical protein
MNTKTTSQFLHHALGLILLSVLVLGSASPARAAQRCYVKADAAGLNDGTSWGDANTNLQSALVNPNCTEVWVAAGTYRPATDGDRAKSFVLKNGVSIYGGFDGGETLLTERDPVANVTILSGELGEAGTADNSFHVVVGSGTGSTAVLDGFTITGGHADGLPGVGGGVYNVAGTPSLANLIFTGNSATDKGGAMFNDLASPALTNVTFSSNTASQGGAIYNHNSNPTLTNATFSLNSTNDLGGAVYNHNSSPTLTTGAFTSNSAVSGGAMYNYASSPNLTGVTFSGNSAIAGGGAMYNYLGSSPILKRVTFSGNSANLGGGAMYNHLNSNPNLANARFLSNTSNDLGGGMYNNNSSPVLTVATFKANAAVNKGGGIFNAGSSPSLTSVNFVANLATRGAGMWNEAGSSPSLTKVNFNKNKASDSGGGMFNAGGSPTLVNVTFSGNTAAAGGGMANSSSSSLTLRDVTFATNSAVNGGGMWNEASSSSLNGVTFRANSAISNGGAIFNNFSDLSLTNATFSGNKAAQHGGMLYVNSSSPVLKNVTARSNTAALGGGVYASLGTLIITNSILYGNTGGEISSTGTTVDVTYSIVKGGYAGTGNLNANPLLMSLANYGGLTKTMPLRLGSPAIDAGDNTTCPATDQRGVVRSKDGDGDGTATCDMGATESSRGTLTYPSVAAEDGWIIETNETSEVGGGFNATSAAIFLGDRIDDRQYRSILSFNTASLPDTASITSATLRIRRARVVGTNPFTTHGNILADVYKGAFSDDAALQKEDFQAAAGLTGAITITDTPVSGWYSGAMPTANYPFINKTGTTQFRLRFTLDDDDDLSADYLQIFSGNAAAVYQPVFVVIYYAP